MNGQKPRPPQSWSDDENGGSGTADAAEPQVKVDVADEKNPPAGDTASEH
jgi:hypothetical protein